MTRIGACTAALALVCSAAAASADPLACTLSGYKAAPGLTAAVADNVLTLTWDGDRAQEVRLRLGIDGGRAAGRGMGGGAASTAARRPFVNWRSVVKAARGPCSPPTRPRISASSPACGGCRTSNS